MSQIHFLGRSVPAWVLIAVILAAGAGAVTTVALDELDGNTSAGVSQGLRVGQPVNNATSDADAFLGSVNDDGTAFSTYIEANNGDLVVYDLPIYNYANNASVTLADLTMEVPSGFTVWMDSSHDGDDSLTVVQVGEGAWKLGVPGGGMTVLTVFIKISPTAPTGVYELSAMLEPARV